MTCRINGGSCFNPRTEAMLDHIETFNMKKYTRVKSKKIKEGATGIIFNMFSVAHYSFLFKDELVEFKKHYSSVVTICVVELDDKKVMSFPIEDLEEITE